MKEPTVDVIIPTYKPNEKQFMELIDCLEKQTYPVHKIIIMNTEERYFSSLVYGNRFEMEHNVSITHISKMEFDHGHTRREGVSKSDADLFVCMTDDAMFEMFVQRKTSIVLQGTLGYEVGIAMISIVEIIESRHAKTLLHIGSQ